MLLCVVGFCWLTRSDQFGITPQRLEFLANARFKGTKCPGLSGSVALNSAIVFSKALGKAYVEQDGPLATASVHRLASLSKPVTGTIERFYPAHPLEHYDRSCRGIKSALAIMTSSEVELESQLDLAWSH